MVNKRLSIANILAEISPYRQRGVSLTDALIEYCKKTGIDPEDVGNIIKKDPSSLQILTEEATKNKMVNIENEGNLDEFFN